MGLLPSNVVRIVALQWGAAREERAKKFVHIVKGDAAAECAFFGNLVDDGVWLGVSTAEQDAENQHRALIIITDRGDNHSRYNLRETTKLLQEADAPVFAVMAGPAFELPEFLSMP
jgi:hypothetical protein